MLVDEWMDQCWRRCLPQMLSSCAIFLLPALSGFEFHPLSHNSMTPFP